MGFELFKVHNSYAAQVRRMLRTEWSTTTSEPLHDEVLNSGENLKKRISLAQRSQYNYILVVGDEEEKNKTVNVRTRDGDVLGEMSIEHFSNLIKEGMAGAQTVGEGEKN